MSGELSPIDKAKFVAAKRAAQYVEDGMRVGVAFYFAYIMYSHNKSIEAPPLAIVQATTESRGGPNRNAADIAMEVYPMQPSKR